MPYIKPMQREELLGLTNKIESHFVQTPGELHYLFALLIKSYLNQNGMSYQNVNDCIGALECAKLELYRRHVAAYEDEKMKENGDV